MKPPGSRKLLAVAAGVALLLVIATCIGVYNLDLSPGAKARKFQTVGADLKTLATEITRDIPDLQWEKTGLHTESRDLADRDPEPCGRNLNGLDNTFACSYSVQTTLSVSSQSDLDRLISRLNKAIATSSTQAFGKPSLDTEQKSPNLSGPTDSDYNNNESAITIYTFSYRKHTQVNCYMRVSYIEGPGSEEIKYGLRAEFTCNL